VSGSDELIVRIAEVPGPVVVVLSMGGTVSSVREPGREGSVPRVDASALLGDVGSLSGLSVVSETFRMLPSSSVTGADVTALAARIRSLGATGRVTGVVVTHGTDTLEETAFTLELLAAATDVPVVVTGAMRDGSDAAPDGPGNLRDAVLAAASSQVRGCGVLVVFDSVIHSARWVSKETTFRAAGFSSAPLGPIGWIVEDRVRVFSRPLLGFRLGPGEGPTAPIAVLATVPGDDMIVADAALRAGYRGVVLAGAGGGHVARAAVPVLSAVAAEIPVVVSTRVPRGPALSKTYGYPGSEVSLRHAGCLMSGVLDAAKSSVLLSALVARGADRAAVAEAFAAFA
jgi:L-asparaginase